MAIVVDASVAVAWCFPLEEGSEEAGAVAMQILEEPGIAPGIFWYEIRNVLIGAERRGRIAPGGCERFLTRLSDLRIEIDQEHNSLKVLGLARRHRLTVYDAAYLETAVRRQAALATLDTALAAACGGEGVANLLG